MKFFLLLLGIWSACVDSARGQDSLPAYFIQHKLLKSDQFRMYKETQMVLHAEIDSLAKAVSKGKKNPQREISNRVHWLDVNPEEDTLAALAKYLMVTSGQSMMVYPGWHVSFQKDTAAIQVATDSLHSFSAALFGAGLISRGEWKVLQDAIQKNEIEDSLSVVMKASFEKEKTAVFRKAKFFSWLTGLATAGLLTTAKADSLANLARKEELRSLYTVLQGSPQAVVIDMNNYPAEPDHYMKAIHEKVALLLPGLSFDSFRYRIEINKQESFSDYTSYQVVVDLWQKGKQYSMAGFHSPPDDSTGMMKNFGKIDHDFYQVFNKMLRDQQSPYRLFAASVMEENKANYDDFAILALTRQQADAVKAGNLIPLSDEDFTLPLTSSTINEAIHLYRQIGLFSHLSPLQIDSAIVVIRQSKINCYGDILSHFPTLIFEIDLEYGVNRGQYREITNDLALVSRGYFRPAAIVDGYDYRKRRLPFVYGFTLNKKVYRTKLKQDDDWLDPGFWELVEKAVKEQDKKGRFYAVYPNDGMRVIYLTHEQYRLLKEKQLLEFDPMEE